MITKNISVIQGQNPDGTFSVAKLDSNGYLSTSTPDSQIAQDTEPYLDPYTSIPKRYINTISGPLDAGTDPNAAQMFEVGVMDGAFNPSGSISVNDKKLLIEQGKQFQTVYVNALDTASISQEADYISWITSNIGLYVAQHGPRYDDLIISGVNGGSQNHNFLIITIIRYY